MGESLTAADWIFCIVLSIIGLILGFVRAAQGEGRGWKMIAISLIADVAKGFAYYASMEK